MLSPCLENELLKVCIQYGFTLLTADLNWIHYLGILGVILAKKP